MSWSEQDVFTASKLWREGKSGAEIAKRLGVSRNAVLGLAHRRRDLFPATGRVSSKQTIEKRKPSMWTEAVLVDASCRWKRGESLDELAAATGATLSALTGLLHRRRDLFPARARAKSKRPETPVVMPVFEAVTPKPSSNDFGRFQIAGTEPIAFADLKANQCRFPLECFEAVSGPTTPCCGAPTNELASYCSGHRRVMARAA